MTRTRNSTTAVSKGRKVRRALVAGGSALVLGSAGLVGGATGPVGASHGARHGSGVLDTTDWRVCDPLDLGDNRGMARGWAITVWNQHPEISVTYLGRNCDQANIFYRAHLMPETWYSQTTCTRPLDPGDNCRRKQTALNMRTIEAAPNPWMQWKKTACQTFGQVGGLGRRFTNNSCLTEGVSPPIVPLPDQHDNDALAATYPR
jgi:hypothetical protein